MDNSWSFVFKQKRAQREKDGFVHNDIVWAIVLLLFNVVVFFLF